MLADAGAEGIDAGVEVGDDQNLLAGGGVDTAVTLGVTGTGNYVAYNATNWEKI